MRTTVTLDQDVDVQIERIQRERQTSCKAVVNAAIRRGLDQMTHNHGDNAVVRSNRGIGRTKSRPAATRPTFRPSKSSR